MMRTIRLSLAIAAIFVFAGFAPVSPDTEGPIEWLSFEEAVKRNDKEPRLFIFDIYTDWCGWCKKMDATTFKNPTIVAYVKKHYYAVKMDGEYKEDIEFGGKTYKFVANGRRGYHELPANLMNGKMSYPTLVFMNADYQVIQPLPGFRQARELERILKYFGSGAFENNITYETFQQDESQFDIP